MSIRFSVDRAAGYYVTTLEGQLNESDIRVAYSTFYSAPGWSPAFDRIIDLSGADITGIPEAAFGVMAQRVRDVMSSNGRHALRTAFVVPDDGNYAQVEHYKRYADVGFETVAMFRDFDGARAWLLER